MCPRLLKHGFIDFVHDTPEAGRRRFRAWERLIGIGTVSPNTQRAWSAIFQDDQLEIQQWHGMLAF